MKFESPALDAYLLQEKITEEQKKHRYELWVLTFWIFLTDAVIYIRNSWEPIEKFKSIIEQTRFKNRNPKYYNIKYTKVRNVEWSFLPYLKSNVRYTPSIFLRYRTVICCSTVVV